VDRTVDLPATAGVTYLNTGSAGPLLASAAAAMTGQLERELTEGRAGQAAWELFLASRQQLRAGLGALVGAGADEITLTHHTTEGLNIALWGLDWRAGDRVLLTSLEHAAAQAAVLTLARRHGLAVDVIDCGTGQRDTVLAALAEALTTPARLLVTSHVSWSTGAVLPVDQMAAAAHAAGAASWWTGRRRSARPWWTSPASAPTSTPSTATSGSAARREPAGSRSAGAGTNG
jgi:L-cysteine/cystine lyase